MAAPPPRPAGAGRRVRLAVVLALALAAVACGGGNRVTGATAVPSTAVPSTAVPAVAPAQLGHRVVARYPHDPAAFTQGLLFAPDGRLFESTGRYGRSTVRQVDPTSGRLLRSTPLPAEQFGEGLAWSGDGLVQVTWQEGVANRWSPADLSLQGRWSYEGEGWGLSTMADGRLVMSDGSSVLTFRNPADFGVLARVEVTEAGAPVTRLNELEVVDGAVWANIWTTNRVVRIDPVSGRVTAALDLSDLVPPGVGAESVLNGIAHRPGDPPGRLWVTGKDWPVLYVIDVA